MARRELATAAADLLIIDRPSARDLEAVDQRFHPHPLDLDALFYVPLKSSSQTYGQYFRLTIAWPELTGSRLQMVDATFIVRSDALAIISHHPSPVLAAVMNVWQHQGHDDQRAPLELLVDSLSVIARSIESAAASTTVDPVLMTSLTTALQALPNAAGALGLGFSEHLEQRLAMIQHRIKYAGESMVTAKRALAPMAAAGRLGRLIRGYALASAGLILLVVATVLR
jgi:hypothetical protein